MRIPATLCLSAALLLCCAVITAHAGVPELMNYQGILLDTGGNPITATVTVRFSIHNDILGGTLLWAESQSVTPDAQGRFNVLLGDGTSLPPNNPLNDAVFAELYAYLEIQVESDPPMTPRTRIVTTGFAYRVSTVDGATGGTIYSKLTVGVTNTNPDTWGYVYGRNNDANGDYSVIAGGHDNTTEQRYSFIGGGQFNYTGHEYCTIAGGEYDTASGRASTISGGNHNAARGEGSIVAGGFYNQANDDRATVSGGVLNVAGLEGSTVAGGYSNTAGGDHSTVSGGEFNTATTLHGTVGGGDHNTAGGQKAFVGGGANNNAWGHYSVIVGGGSSSDADSNATTGDYSSIVGGQANIARGGHSFVGGGKYNRAFGDYSVVAGGGGSDISDSNLAQGTYSVIGGGRKNVASGIGSAIGGGMNNEVSDGYATVGGGSGNEASEWASTVPGGSNNCARGEYSHAAGHQAKANHDGSMVLSATTSSTVTDSIGTGKTSQMVFRADGDFYFTDAGGAAPYTSGRLINTSSGAYLTTGGTWTNSSDRNLKENFATIDRADLLEKLATLDITQWNYKKESEDIRHIGPVAQDFHALFGLGTDNKSISTIDAEGIALAAIQALYEKTSELENQVRRTAELEDKVERLESLVQQLLEEQQ